MARGSSASTGVSIGGATGRAGVSTVRGGFGSIEGGRGGRPSSFSSRELSRFNTPNAGRPNLRLIDNKNFEPKTKKDVSNAGFRPYLVVDNKYLIPNQSNYNTGSKPFDAVNDNSGNNVTRFLKYVDRKAANDNFPVRLNRFNKYSEQKGVNDNVKIDPSLIERKSVDLKKPIKIQQASKAIEAGVKKPEPYSIPVFFKETKYSPELSRIIARRPIFDQAIVDFSLIKKTEERDARKSAIEVLGKRNPAVIEIKRNNMESPRIMREEIKTALRIEELQREIKMINKANEPVLNASKLELPRPVPDRTLSREAEVRYYLAKVNRDLKKGKIEPIKIKPTSERIRDIQAELRSIAQSQLAGKQNLDSDGLGNAEPDSKDPKKKYADKREEKQKNKFYVVDTRARSVREEIAKEALRKIKYLEDKREIYGSGVMSPQIDLPANPPRAAISEIANAKDGSYTGFRRELTEVKSVSSNNIDMVIKAVNDNNNPVRTSDRNTNPATREEVQKVLNG